MREEVMNEERRIFQGIRRQIPPGKDGDRGK